MLLVITLSCCLLVRCTGDLAEADNSVSILQRGLLWLLQALARIFFVPSSFSVNSTLHVLCSKKLLSFLKYVLSHLTVLKVNKLLVVCS